MRSNFRYVVLVSLLAILVLAACSAPATTEAPVSNQEAIVASPEQPTEAAPTTTAAPTKTPEPTRTPKPTATRLPTLTPRPTATPDVNLVKPGTYLVGVDILPGIYKGLAGTSLGDSCYWQRLKDLSGSFDAIIANDNSIGQFYVEIARSDYAFEVHCQIRRLETLPAPLAQFPTTLEPGTYLVGIDIKPGLYKGQAGDDISNSCYWQRMKNVLGSFSGILANDNAIGQYFIKVAATDFALMVNCPVTLQE